MVEGLGDKESLRGRYCSNMKRIQIFKMKIIKHK